MEYTKSSEFKKEKVKPCLKIKDTIIFNINNIQYKGIVLDYSGLFFIQVEDSYNNSIIFQKLGLNPFTFVEEIQGYDECLSQYDSIWPYSKSLEDLTKVVRKLLKLCEKTLITKVPEQGIYINPIPISVGFTQFEKGKFYCIGKTIFQCWTDTDSS